MGRTLSHDLRDRVVAAVDVGSCRAAAGRFGVPSPELAKELEGTGVPVHGISPWALTPMLQSSSADKWAKHGPEIAAPLGVYLLSDAAVGLNGKMVRTAEGSDQPLHRRQLRSGSWRKP